MVCDLGKAFKDRLDIWFEYLCEVIRLFQAPCLACAIDEYQRTFIPIAYCTLRVDWCCMPLMKLVLYTSRMSPFLFRVTLRLTVRPPTKNVTSSDHKTFNHFVCQNTCAIAQMNRAITCAAVRYGF